MGSISVDASKKSKTEALKRVQSEKFFSALLVVCVPWCAWRKWSCSADLHNAYFAYIAYLTHKTALFVPWLVGWLVGVTGSDANYLIHIFGTIT